MADQYVPQTPRPSQGMPANPASRPAFAPIQPEITPQRSSGASGWGAALLVCAVFVVVAVLAAMLYSRTGGGQVVNQPEQNVIESDGTVVQTPAEAIPGLDPVNPAEGPVPSASDPAAAPATQPVAPATQPAAPVQP